MIAAVVLLPAAYYVWHLGSKFALARAIKASRKAGHVWWQAPPASEVARRQHREQAARALAREMNASFGSRISEPRRSLLSWTDYPRIYNSPKDFASYRVLMPRLFMKDERHADHPATIFWGGLGRRGDRDRVEAERAFARLIADKLEMDLAQWLAMARRVEAAVDEDLPRIALSGSEMAGFPRGEILTLSMAAHSASDSMNPSLCFKSLMAMLEVSDLALRKPPYNDQFLLCLDNGNAWARTLWHALDAQVFRESELAALQQALEAYDVLSRSQRRLARLRTAAEADFDLWRSSPLQAMSHLMYRQTGTPSALGTVATWRDLLNPATFFRWTAQLVRAPLKVLHLDYFGALHWIYVESYWEEREWNHILNTIDRLLAATHPEKTRVEALDSLWRMDKAWRTRSGLSWAMDLPSAHALTVLDAEVTRLLALHAVALHRFKLRHGVFPDSLALLLPEFLPKLTPDPMTGEPLFYRQGADHGFTLYSAGFNGKDDGGDGSAPDWPGSDMLEPIGSPGLFFPCGKDQVWPVRADSRAVFAAQEAWIKAVQSGAAFRPR